jgi:AraC-like DNA-binding protein
MPEIQKGRINSANPEELARALSRLYCPHTTLFSRSNNGIAATLEIRHAGSQPVVELRYGAPVKVDAGEFPRLMLMQTCLEGSGSATQQGVSVSLRKSETMPLSAGLSTQLEFDARFAQRSVRLDIERLESQCARMLNHPLDRGLRFELRPFSEHLEKAWTEAVSLVTTYATMDLTLPVAAAANLDEFLISLVLTQHPHNYTDDFQARTRALPPRLIREAEHLMRTGGNELTVSAIAAHLRVSLRSLEAGFREYRRTTPLQRLRAIRLERARQNLLTPQPCTTVTSAALECGFVHLARFSGYYKAAFGESPAQTLRRSRSTRPPSDSAWPVPCIWPSAP